MSNHGGSYMLNKVLGLIDDYGMFNSLGKEEMKEFVKSVVKIGYIEDCNNGEILEGIGDSLGICYGCLRDLTEDDVDEDGMPDNFCNECR